VIDTPGPPDPDTAAAPRPLALISSPAPPWPPSAESSQAACARDGKVATRLRTSGPASP
jgi:hypothetical protein